MTVGCRAGMGEHIRGVVSPGSRKMRERAN